MLACDSRRESSKGLSLHTVFTFTRRAIQLLVYWSPRHEQFRCLSGTTYSIHTAADVESSTTPDLPPPSGKPGRRPWPCYSGPGHGHSTSLLHRNPRNSAADSRGPVALAAARRRKRNMLTKQASALFIPLVPGPINNA
jgi:hypothetical protein